MNENVKIDDRNFILQCKIVTKLLWKTINKVLKISWNLYKLFDLIKSLLEHHNVFFSIYYFNGRTYKLFHSVKLVSAISIYIIDLRPGKGFQSMI